MSLLRFPPGLVFARTFRLPGEFQGMRLFAEFRTLVFTAILGLVALGIGSNWGEFSVGEEPPLPLADRFDGVPAAREFGPPSVNSVKLGMRKVEVDNLFEETLPIISGFPRRSGRMFFYSGKNKFAAVTFGAGKRVVYVSGSTLLAGGEVFAPESPFEALTLSLGPPDGGTSNTSFPGSQRPAYYYFVKHNIGVESRDGRLTFKLDADPESLKRGF